MSQQLYYDIAALKACQFASRLILPAAAVIRQRLLASAIVVVDIQSRYSCKPDLHVLDCWQKPIQTDDCSRGGSNTGQPPQEWKLGLQLSF